MTFLQLFNMYCAFMESNTLRHQELVIPIRAYARSIGVASSVVLKDLQSTYVPLPRY